MALQGDCGTEQAGDGCQRSVPEGPKELVSPSAWSEELVNCIWPDSKVRVYSSGDRVQLLLNGKEVDRSTYRGATQRKVEFEVAYAPGELKAVFVGAKGRRVHAPERPVSTGLKRRRLRRF